ncbi:hypothetical protein RHSIM_RhsimUnG0033600 [Rhododendron simsii]|uniref:Galactose oxidase/kelch repeat superfamily protein n=1 Tax=Rhododendron simsii TaxID=118357 RepID=A0A834FWC0_RHOSS|nr:hypothetical protein RHSIM_RhsimUnG0033600 [Rhododendron simsii]
MFPASSSPSRSRPHQKTAYVRAVSQGDYEMEFYSVAINHDVSGEEDCGEDGSVRILTPIKAPNVPLHGGFAAMDNKLYCMGGDPPYRAGRFYEPVRRFYALDTSSRNRTKSSWKKRASMRNGRFLPPTVVVDGKIFVFGGIEGPYCHTRHWAEVFDTKSGRWSSLLPPPQLPTAYGLFAVALPDLGKILVGSCEDEFLYTYYPEEGLWELLDHKMVFGISCHVKPVAVHATLFWFDDCNLHAYNLVDKWSYSGCIKDLEKVVPLESLMPPNVDLFYPAVHHVAGNVFSLLCLEYFSSEHRATLLHCVKFSISDLVVQGGEDVCFNAAVRSADAYSIQTPSQILDAVVIVVDGLKTFNERIACRVKWSFASLAQLKKKILKCSVDWDMSLLISEILSSINVSLNPIPQ